MRRLAWICCVVALAGCAPNDEQADVAADSAAMAAPAATEPAAITLADVAGTWNFTSKREGTDSVLVAYQIIATTDTADWKLVFTNPAKTVDMHVLNVAGDSIVTHAGPYESVIYKGATVTTHSVLRLIDGRLVGNTVARYNRTTADSVVNLMTEGTRAQ